MPFTLYHIAGNFRGRGNIFVEFVVGEQTTKVLPPKNVTYFRPHPIIAVFHEIFYHEFAHFLNSTKILPPGNYPLYCISPAPLVAYLMLSATRYDTNNTELLITDVQQGGYHNPALVCFTDDPTCCENEGDWYFPDGTAVLSRDDNPDTTDTFVRDRIPPSTGFHAVRLHRLGSIVSPTGLYCCEVPVAIYGVQRVCVNLGEWDSISLDLLSYKFMFAFFSYYVNC